MLPQAIILPQAGARLNGWSFYRRDRLGCIQGSDPHSSQAGLGMAGFKPIALCVPWSPETVANRVLVGAGLKPALRFSLPSPPHIGGSIMAIIDGQPVNYLRRREGRMNK